VRKARFLVSFDFTRCCGGLFATTLTARSNRSQASECRSLFVLVLGMAFNINPAFDRFPVEAILVGRILASFGEIELTVCRNAGKALELEGLIMKALYRLRATSQRIDLADELMKWVFADNGLAEDYDGLIRMVRHCLKIRNQYSHCNWGDHATAGLFFADVQESAEHPDFEHYWKHVDPPLLQNQLDYLGVTMDMLELTQELAVRQGLLRSHVWPRPTVPAPPPLHNPEAQHVPPWLNEDRQALHLARALAAQGGTPTPTPAQQALDRARAEAKARRKAHAERSAKGSSNPPDQE
jgi:hypothetical protein